VPVIWDAPNAVSEEELDSLSNAELERMLAAELDGAGY
jgi:hypothetical protein